MRETNNKEYGMFSILGNHEVRKIVARAKRQSLKFGEVLKLLRKLERRYPEALDTDVRERVHLELYGDGKGKGEYVALMTEDGDAS